MRRRAALAAALWRRGYARILAFVFAFFCAEAARGYLFTGFPWNLFGEAVAANDAHMQMAAYIGVYGLTLAALFIFSAPAAAFAAAKARFGRLWHATLLRRSRFGRKLTPSGANASANQARARWRACAFALCSRISLRRKNGSPRTGTGFSTRTLQLSRSGIDGRGHLRLHSCHLAGVLRAGAVRVSTMASSAPEVRDRLAALIPPATSLILGAERAEGDRTPEGRYIFGRVFNSLFVLGEGAEMKSDLRQNSS